MAKQSTVFQRDAYGRSLFLVNDDRGTWLVQDLHGHSLAEQLTRGHLGGAINVEVLYFVLGGRIQTLQNERQSRWQKILKLLPGVS